MSNTQNHGRASDRLIAKLMEKGINVTANIHDSQQVGPELFRVICSFSTIAADPHTLQQAVANAVGNDFSAVEGSFRKLNSVQHAAVGFIRANTVSKPFVESEVAGLDLMRGDSKQTAGNLLMDATDSSMWSVQSSGDSKYLVRQAPDNLSDLVQMAKVRAFNIPRLGQMALASIQRNDYIAFVHPTTKELAHGFQVLEGADSLTVLCADGSKVEIANELVVETAHLTTALSEYAVEAKIDLPDVAKSKGDIEAYYNFLYGKAGEFFTELKSVIQQHSIL